MDTTASTVAYKGPGEVEVIDMDDRRIDKLLFRPVIKGEETDAA